MVVSLIQSLFSSFGSGVHAAGTGITLHNRGGGFVLDEAHPNVLQPGKRPFHTLMPGLALRDGRPWLAFGTRGADGQPQTGLQMLVGLIDLGLSAQETIEAPRWVHDPPGDRFTRDALVLESGLAPAATELSQRGHDVVVTEPLDYIMGTVQMIRVDQERGYLEAVSDPRGDGVALAL
jgi:gamma-glutamyltranspeptidase/glutathione hydrolase